MNDEDPNNIIYLTRSGCGSLGSMNEIILGYKDEQIVYKFKDTPEGAIILKYQKGGGYPVRRSVFACPRNSRIAKITPGMSAFRCSGSEGKSINDFDRR